MWSPIVRQWAPVRKLPNGKVSWIVGPWEFAQELTKSWRTYPSIPYFCLLIKAVLNPNFWIPCGGMLQVRSLLSIHQPYSMRLECFNMLFAQQIVTRCVKNCKEVNGKSHEIWVWEVEYWEATANLESARSAPLPHRGAVALLQQLRHHAVRENVAGPPVIKGHGIFLRNLKLEDLWTGSRDPLWLRKWREHQTWPSYSVILNSLYFFNFEKPTGFRQSAEKGTFLCSQFERWPLKSTGVHNRRCTNSFRLPQKTPPCCNVRSSLAMQSSVPVKRLGIGRWPGKF